MAKGSTPTKINFWQMVRDIFVASINKGQFPLACVFAVILVILIRISPEDLSKLVWRLLDDLESHKLLGYALFVVTLAGAFVHARFLRKMASGEMKRVSVERNILQAKVLGQPVKSSDEK